MEKLFRIVGRVKRTEQLPEKIGDCEAKDKVLEVLKLDNFDEIYNTLNLDETEDLDSAIKMMLEEKLIDTIKETKKYVKKSGIKRIGATEVLLAGERKRW
ncbi:MAG: hypothetical protein QW045_01680 [Candidatus Micrarchaeaceae archaeon]